MCGYADEIGQCVAVQVKLQDMYETYFQEDTYGRYPPIPTVRVDPPGARDVLTQMHKHKAWGQKWIEPGRIDDIMREIWLKMRKLELFLDVSNRDRNALRKVTGTTPMCGIWVGMRYGMSQVLHQCVPSG
jgi:hypothetical protein